jgi:hypothetical protein
MRRSQWATLASALRTSSGGLLLATVATQLRERAELLEPVLGGLEAAIGPVEVLLRRGEGTFGLPELGLPVGRAVLEERPEFGLFGAEPLDAAGCVVDGEHKPR